MDRRVKRKTLVSYHEARKLLEGRIKEDIVLDIQNRTWEYLKMFGDKDPEAARRLVEKLVEIGVKEVVAVNIVNLCPQDPGEVRLILSMDKETSYPLDIPEKILGLLEEYCSSTQ